MQAANELPKVFGMKEARRKDKSPPIVCDGCSEEVTERCVQEGNCVMANGKLWHREHLRCDQCKIMLKEFVPNNKNQLLCKDCHMTRITSSCMGCDGPFFETYLLADGKKWHNECFKCAQCKCTVPGKVYITINGQNYDEDCGRKVQLTRQL